MCRGRRFGGGASDSDDYSAPCSRLLLLLLLLLLEGVPGEAVWGWRVRLLLLLRAVFPAAAAAARVYSSEIFFALTRQCMVQKFSSR